MTATDYGRPATFRIGRVLTESFRVFGRNALVCSILALTFVGVPSLVLQLLPSPPFGLNAGTDSFQLNWPVLAIGLIFGSFLKAALAFVVISDLSGSRAGLASSIRVGAANYLPALVISFFASVAIWLGLLLLIVPGVILIIRWAVVIPVQVNEHRGIVDSFRRSAELTAGNRWRLLALLLISLLLPIIVNILFAAASSLAVMRLADGHSPYLAYIVMAAEPMAVTLKGLIAAILAAVAYVELRFAKEGHDVKDLAEIFA